MGCFSDLGPKLLWQRGAPRQDHHLLLRQCYGFGMSDASLLELNPQLSRGSEADRSSISAGVFGLETKRCNTGAG